MWAMVCIHAVDRCINARMCIPEIILQARVIPLAMLEVRGDEVNFESSGSGLYEHQNDNIDGVTANTTAVPNVMVS